MRVLQRYLAVSIIQAVAFVLVAFLALAAFVDLTQELPSVGDNGYALQHAMMFVLLSAPGNISLVMPVAALIGTIYTLAQFASTSEFTIMRASGMSTRQALFMLFRIGIVFVAFTYLFSEVITPRTAPVAERIKLSGRGTTLAQEFRSGMWTKDVVRSDGRQGQVTGSRFFNARRISNDGQLSGVKIYEFDPSFRLRSVVTAASASYTGENTWTLSDVRETRFSNSVPLADQDALTFGQSTSLVHTRTAPTMELVSEITPRLVTVAGSRPERMSAKELALYNRHLAENRQDSEAFEIAFWKKLFDPLAIFVLMALALPFAYLQTRSGGVSRKIFSGIMIGLGFILLNQLFSHLGKLSSVMPAMFTAAAPSLLFLALALGALWWVERR